MLITFEGIDGCGKSTQIELLKKHLSNSGVTFSVFREPGGTGLSEKIRTLLLHETDEMDPVTELLLFSAARSRLIREKVIPKLNKGEIVILDRFYDSTTAYQGYGRQSAKPQEIDTLNALASHHTIPDLTFYLRLSVEEAAERTSGTNKDRMENAGDDFFNRVVDGYDKLSEENERFSRIDATLSPDEIHQQIISIFDETRHQTNSASQ